MKREYPLLAAFDRAIRAESTQHLNLAENADTLFTSLRAVFTDIIEQAQREGALQPGVDVEGASTAMFVLLRGLTDYAATSTVDEYHATVVALKQLISGNLFALAPATPSAVRGRNAAALRIDSSIGAGFQPSSRSALLWSSGDILSTMLKARLTNLISRPVRSPTNWISDDNASTTLCGTAIHGARTPPASAASVCSSRVLTNRSEMM